MFKFDDTLMTLVRNDIEEGLIPMLLGEPGIGKSSWLKHLAELMRTKCFVVACNQLADKADLTGGRLVPITDKNTNAISDYKQVFYPHATISDAITYANEHQRETPILFLDEINRATSDITSAALSIPTERAIGSKTLPNNLRVVIAGNDKGNVTTLDEASISRFVLYKVEPDTSTFLEIHKDTINPFVKKVLTEHPECIFCKTIIEANDGKDDDEDLSIDDILDDGEDMRQFSTPRTIAACSKWLNKFDNKQLQALLADTTVVNGVEMSVLQEAIEGHVGHTNFAIFLFNEISNGVMTTTNQVSSITVSKPSCYDTLKTTTSLDVLKDAVSNLTENEKSGVLLYALYEKDDNKALIETVAPVINSLYQPDVSTLMTLANSQQLDNENVETLLQLDCSVSQSLALILQNNSL